MSGPALCQTFCRKGGRCEPSRSPVLIVQFPISPGGRMGWRDLS
jgi:hypothetical protein